jgi:hypothetical protein
MEAGVMDELWKPHFSEERWGFNNYRVGVSNYQIFDWI